MSRQLSPKKGAEREVLIKTVLVRPFFGAREWFVPPGSTVMDLLARAGARAAGHDIMIGARVVAPSEPLKKGAVVFLVPRTRAALEELTWQDSVGLFRDDAAFREMVEAGRAYRETGRESVGRTPEIDDR